MSRKATIETTLLFAAFCSICVEGLVFAAQPSSSLPVVVISPKEIATGDAALRNPDIAVSAKGRITVAAESGSQSAGRLAVVEFSFHGQSYVKHLDLSGPGDCGQPSLLYDPSGTLHLVWCERTSDTYSVRYAWRTPDNDWRDGGVISNTPELNCAFPQIAYQKSTGRLWVTWHAGIGTRYGIYLAWRGDGDSRFTTIDVTGDAGDHHNLRPQVFCNDANVLLCWYEEIETAFVLRAALFDAQEGKRQDVTPPDFDRLDASKTPELFRGPAGRLGGVWNDLIGNRNRVLLGLQDSINRGEGLVADTTISGEAIEPCAVAVDDQTVALAWMNREPTGSEIYLGRLDGRSNVGESLALQVSQHVTDDDAVSRPRLAVGGGRLVYCVWFSDALLGGSGCLYYAVLRY